MELTKELKTEMDSFEDKFRDKGKKYHVFCNRLGQITKIKSTDKDIIAFGKQLGLD